MQQKLAHKVVCNGAHVTDIVGCFALYPPNLLLNTTSRAHSVNHVKLADIARPQKSTTWKEIIRSLYHLHYISSVLYQSYSVKNSSNNRLSKTFRLCSRLCENCNINTNVHSHLLWYIYRCQAIIDSLGGDFTFPDTQLQCFLRCDWLLEVNTHHVHLTIQPGRQERRRIKEYTKPTRTRAKWTERTDLHKNALFFCRI